MPDAFATGHMHAGILTVLTATDAGMVAASTRGGLTLHTRSLPGEERTALLIRAARDLRQPGSLHRRCPHAQQPVRRGPDRRTRSIYKIRKAHHRR